MAYLGIPAYWIHQCAWELRMAFVRIRSLSPWQRRRIRNVEARESLKIIFGCGDTHYPGWFCIDGLGGRRVDLRFDLRRRLPFNDETVDLCYSEHFVEHLTREESANHLREAHRILRKGGRYRIVVPAADRFMQKYLARDDEFFRLAFPWAETNLEAVYHIVNWNGAHRSIYDIESLRIMGSKAGFACTVESSANGSDELSYELTALSRSALLKACTSKCISRYERR